MTALLVRLLIFKPKDSSVMRKIAGYLTKNRSEKDQKNRPKHTRKRIHQAKKNFLEKFKTASNNLTNDAAYGGEIQIRRHYLSTEVIP